MKSPEHEIRRFVSSVIELLQNEKLDSDTWELISSDLERARAIAYAETNRLAEEEFRSGTGR